MLQVSTFYVAPMTMKAWAPVMQFVTLLLPLHEMLTSMWDENNDMRFLQPHSTLLVNKLTCVHQKWNSHLRWCCHCWSNTTKFILSILHVSRICCLQNSSSQIKELSQPTTHWSFPPFSNWDVWMSKQTSWCVFTWLCQCYVKLQKIKRPSFFFVLVIFLHKKISITL
jgi:hypothetical protein